LKPKILFLKNVLAPKELSKILQIHYVFVIFFLIEKITKYYHHGTFISVTLSLAVWLYLTYILIKFVKDLYYTYWTLGGIFLISLCVDIFLFPNPTKILAMMCVLLLVINFLGLYSPLYYPMVNWWEYDFRFRHDLKIKIEGDNEKEFEGRLTDLRQGAGCILSFEDFEVGKKIKIKISSESPQQIYEAEIKSSRRNIDGRPKIYGVYFTNNDKEIRKIIEKWKIELKQRKWNKYADN